MSHPSQSSRARSAPRVVTLMLGAGAVVVVGGAAFGYWDLQQARREAGLRIAAEALAVASQAAGALRYGNAEAHDYLGVAAEKLEAMGSGPFCEYLVTALQPPKPTLLMSMGLLDLDRGLVCLSGGVQLGYVQATPAWLRGIAPAEEREGDLFYGEYAGQWLLGRGRGVETPDGSRMAVVLYLGLGELARLVDPIAEGGGAVLSVWGRDGVLLARTQNAERWIGKMMPGAVQDDRSLIRPDLEGVDRIWSSAPVPGTPWEVRVGVDARRLESDLAPVRTRSRLWGLAVLPFLLLPVLLVWWVGAAAARLRAGVAAAVDAGAEAVPLAGPREIQELGTEFRSALVRQREQAREIETINAQLEERVVERSREISEKAAALGRTNAELADALGAKDGFVRLVSHELRTPLTGILLQAEALLEGVYGPLEPRQARAARRIVENGAHLKGLVDAILEVSSLGAGAVKLSAETTSLEQLVTEAASACRHLFEAKSQSLELSVDGDVALHVDGTRVRLALQHLLENASKFTPPGKRAGVRIENRPGPQPAVAVMVWDEGEGIAQERLGRIFEPFSQEDSRLDREKGGLGLGLPFVRLVAELHGGRVEVSSTTGSGSTFALVLPVR